MYDNPILPMAVPAGAASAIAGHATGWIWVPLAAFAVLAAAMAVMRIVPRNGEM